MKIFLCRIVEYYFWLKEYAILANSAIIHYQKLNTFKESQNVT